MTTMLKSLMLDVPEWGNDKGRLIGKAKFISSYGEVTLNLSPELAEKILALCADSVVDAANTTSKMLKADVVGTLFNTTLNLEMKKS